MTGEKTAKDDSRTYMERVAAIPASTYVNSTTVATIGGVGLGMWDVVKAALSARLNVGLGGGPGMGKSQLFADLRALVGNNSNYVLGRNDLDIKSLFRKLNFKGLTEAMEKGASVSQKELSEVTADIYRPLVVVEEINRCVEIVQNQLFNVFEGFIEIDGVIYPLGKGQLETFIGEDGKPHPRNVLYSVGVWSANFGNGEFTGTVSMDKAMKERTHMIIDVDNFAPGDEKPEDLDDILLDSAGEVRLKSQEDPEDRTELLAGAYREMKQKAITPDETELGFELMAFRYLVQGLNYIPCGAGKNSKRWMKGVWPDKAEEDGIGTGDSEIMLYRMIYPSSIRSGLTIISLARSLRAYAKAKDPKAEPKVMESVIESFKLVAPYSGMLYNGERMRDSFVGNPYAAAIAAGTALSARLDSQDARDIMQAIVTCKSEGKPLPSDVVNKLTGDYECFK